MTREEELARAEYEREQEEGKYQKYLVYPKTPETSKYLERRFGYRDSYVVSFPVLLDLVSNYVNSDDDIELYEHDGSWNGDRIYDVLGFVFE